MKINPAFILVGGSIKAAFHVGVLKELLKRGITPEAVFGISSGSINGSILLSTPNLNKNLLLMENYWKKINKGDIFPLNIKVFYKFIFSSSIYSSKGIEGILKKFLKKDNFSSLSRKFYVLATDHSNGEPAYFSKGRLIEKILASSAVPGLFPPVKIKENYYVDGGLSGEMGIKKAEQLGYNPIIIINPANDPCKENKDNLYHNIMGTLDSINLNYIEQDKKKVKKSKLIEIRADKKFSGKFMSFDLIKEMISDGEKKAEKVLDKLKIYSKQDLKRVSKV